MACSGHVSSVGAGTFMVVDSLEGLLPTGDDTILPVSRRKKIRRAADLSTAELWVSSRWRPERSEV